MKYMDRPEMLRRLREGETPAGIDCDRWKRLMPPINGGFDWFWFDAFCHNRASALCETYGKKGKCNQCPVTGCGFPNQPWARMVFAASDENRDIFMKARRLMIRRLLRAIHRGE